MTTPTEAQTPNQAVTGERADLLATLAKARFFLRYTARDLTEEQARTRSTPSALTIGGLIKHVAAVEDAWAKFAVQGASAMPSFDKDFSELTEEDVAEFSNGFRLTEGETLAGVLADYEQVAARTDALIAEVDSLDVERELPKAPWFTETHWSLRRVFLHLISETTQHSGHADIIREAIDGAKSMG